MWRFSAIHLRLTAVSSRSRRASATLVSSPLRRRLSSALVQPSLLSSSCTILNALACSVSSRSRLGCASLVGTSIFSKIQSRKSSPPNFQPRRIGCSCCGLLASCRKLSILRLNSRRLRALSLTSPCSPINRSVLSQAGRFFLVVR